MTDVRRLAGEADLGAWVEIHNALAPNPVTAEEVRAYREALAGGETHLLALADGEPAGVGLATLDAGKLPRSAAFAWLGVLPAQRGKGLGTALYESLSDWAREAGLDRLESHVAAEEAEGLAWAARRGFEEAGRDTWLALDITALPPVDPRPPEGVEITTWAEQPELARGLYEVASEAYPDVPGREENDMAPFEDWLALDMGGPNDRPEAVFVAVAGGEVIGYSKLHLSDAMPGVAWNDMTGVRRAWRRRGIAGALKRAQLVWAQAQGYERLETANETRNAPIQRLNESLGYRPFSERVLLAGPLAPGNPPKSSYSHR